MGNGFELIGELTEIEIIAVNLSIRELRRLKAQFGGRRWRKLKGVGLVQFPNGEIRKAELHWYESHRKFGSETPPFYDGFTVKYEHLLRNIC
ncbi:hypothetical protein [Microcystis sp. M176S2]|uniref:hypothetical protein n=1 Tax=Microcystis sp. M176S2 TaxID=2771159 RepID=UPI00258F0199|nr:hypothetical protein [Microcystis sp. M176S2]